MELLSYYALFLAKTVTIVVAIAALIVMISHVALRKRHEAGQLRLTDLGERYRHMKEDMQLGRMKHHQQKLWHKAQKKKEKQQEKAEKKRARLEGDNAGKPVLYIIDFKGSMDAGEVASLREEVSAVLAVAGEQDEVLLRLESPGGVVHGYGLAASQLQRLRQKGIRLTVAVDKVAASGGYMMACVADNIVAAPFSVIGSIGVVAQIPNFNRLLKRNDIDIELHTAGQYKRTLTLLGENTEEGREKFREDLNETHLLFKQFVQQMRPTLDIDQVATGEHWYGSQAREKGLVDEINTSDDVILRQLEHFEVIAVRYLRKKKMMDRFTHSVSKSMEQLLLRLWQRGNRPLN
ncbi:protease SohB [Erwinia sp. OLTSP20]|uniref:protease SohB n=1 Tax=unclassified Erwinia TaxID=2622719 RepID=UPI000C186931|nr:MULTISPECIES: protease SohB [unclassified Erwinia]PIJ51804.1 protease SohB [Erwinia sp. OAMSP11]PIJ74392.1 protease SohB [Erwinia sp. OLSSP12]PIJ83775.1 protease SohB [Erwinia sp. OLCASP19]PIJ86818.1 protease SohB [Erwinia sp. OLMTSP26]PIJ88225.1 protease SohB [Erwinia sp. OLMDSP33]